MILITFGGVDGELVLRFVMVGASSFFVLVVENCIKLVGKMMRESLRSG